MGVILIGFGALALVVGIFGKDFFVADVFSLRAFKQKSSIWSGRLVFLLVGVGQIAVGIKLLIAGTK